jgi:hypothetical protein
MNKSILLALSLIASGGAFANEAADELANRASFAGERTRAEVKAEVLRAQRAGTLSFNEYQANQQQPAQGLRARSDIRAEAVQAARTRVIHEQI